MFAIFFIVLTYFIITGGLEYDQNRNICKDKGYDGLKLLEDIPFCFKISSDGTLTYKKLESLK